MKKFVLSAILSLFLLSGCGQSDNMSNNQDSVISSSSSEQMLSDVNDKDNKFVYKNTTKSAASTKVPEVDPLLKERLDRAKHKSEFISPMLPSVVLRAFSRLCKKNGLPHYTMHEQRHGNASLMLAQGVPDKYAMKRLGQSSPNMIKNVYQHLYTSKEDEVSDALDKKFLDLYNK